MNRGSLFLGNRSELDISRLSEWTNEEVTRFLELLDLDELIPIYTQDNVTGKTLIANLELCESNNVTTQKNAQRALTILQGNFNSQGGSTEHQLTELQMLFTSNLPPVLIRNATNPLELVRNVAQVRSGGLSLTTELEIFKEFHKAGNLYKYIQINTLRTIPFNFMQSVLYGTLKVSGYGPVTSGLFSQLIPGLVTYPLETIRLRLSVNPGLYTSTVDCISKIYSLEGISGFFNGLPLFVLGTIPFLLGNQYVFRKLSNSTRLPDKKYGRFLIGCISTLVAQTIAYPFDTVRRVMQNTPNSDNMFRVFYNVIQQDGISGLFRGFYSNSIKLIPYAILSYVVYECTKQFFRWRNGYIIGLFDSTYVPGVNKNWTPDQLSNWRKKKGM